MATTALVAEILAIGIQTLLWIGLAVFGIFEFDSKKVATLLNGPDSVLAVVAAVGLALAYSLGVMVDRIADSLLDRFAEEQKRAIFEKKKLRGEDLNTIRIRALAGPHHVAQFLESIRG